MRAEFLFYQINQNRHFLTHFNQFLTTEDTTKITLLNVKILSVLCVITELAQQLHFHHKHLQDFTVTFQNTLLFRTFPTTFMFMFFDFQMCLLYLLVS